MEGISREELPPAQSRSAATLHDQRFDHVQMQVEVRELLKVMGSLTLDFDDASKRGISFLGSGLHGTRGDGSHLYAVTRVTRLQKDLEAGTTKGGKSTAKSLMHGMECYARGNLEPLLWLLHVLLCDTTNSMTGTLIKTGEGGAASHLRARIEELTRGVNGEQGHLLLEQRDCLSHAGHNECETFMTAMGYCASDRVFQSTKKDIDETKSKKRVWCKVLLDELTEYVSTRPQCIRFIEDEEAKAAAQDSEPAAAAKQGRRRVSLGKPPRGVVTRWGFYGKAAQWYRFDSPRIELIIKYALSKEPRRRANEWDDDGLGADTPLKKIARVKDEGVRAMLYELSNPEKRVSLIIFEWYFTESLGLFLDFTQSARDFQLVRVHRVLRCRLKLMAALKGPTEEDKPDGLWLSELKPKLDGFVSQHNGWAFDEVNPRSIARTAFAASHDDFCMRTRGYFQPLSLIYSVLDEKGEAVLGAQELLQLAGATWMDGKLVGARPMVRFPQLIAFTPGKSSRKGSLHEGVTASMVVEAMKHPSYCGCALAFLPDLWKHVEALSILPPSTVLRNVPELRLLYDLLAPLAKHSPISNGGKRGAESLMKVIGKVCKPQMRLNDETVSRNVRCACRDPTKLHHLTEAEDRQASYDLGHNKASRVKEKIAVPEVEWMEESTLGYSAEGGEEWGNFGSWNEETYVMPPVRRGHMVLGEEGGDEEEGGEDEDEGEQGEGEQGEANSSAEHALQKQSGRTVKNALVTGAMVSALCPQWNGWFYAEVQSVPLPGATGKGARSATLRWLDEVGGEGCGLYAYDKTFMAPQDIAFTNICDCDAVLHEQRAADGSRQWLTDEALRRDASAASAATAASSTASGDGSSSPAVAKFLAAVAPFYQPSDAERAAESAAGFGHLRSMLDESAATKERKASEPVVAEDPNMRERVRMEVDVLMENGVRIHPLCKAMYGSAATGSSSATPVLIDIEPEDIVLRNSKVKRVRISSSAILSNDSEEWLNDNQVGNANAISDRPSKHQIKLNYPRGSNVETVFTSATVTRTVTTSQVLPLVALLQNFVEAAHWRKLIISFSEKIVYSYEPYGSQLRRRHAIMSAFDATLGALDGWRLECIEVQAQSNCDTSSCGVWILEADRAFVSYVDSEQFGTGTFGTFFIGWLEERGVANLKTLTRGQRKHEAIKGNSITSRSS